MRDRHSAAAERNDSDSSFVLNSLSRVTGKLRHNMQLHCSELKAQVDWATSEPVLPVMVIMVPPAPVTSF